jgi:hypothetical protein
MMKTWILWRGEITKFLLSCEEAIRDETSDKILLYHGKNYERKEILSLRKIMKLKESSQH